MVVANRRDLCPTSNEQIDEKLWLLQFDRSAIQHYFNGHSFLALRFCRFGYSQPGLGNTRGSLQAATSCAVLSRSETRDEAVSNFDEFSGVPCRRRVIADSLAIEEQVAYQPYYASNFPLIPRDLPECVQYKRGTVFRPHRFFVPRPGPKIRPMLLWNDK